MRKGETKNILLLSAVTLRPFSQKTRIVFQRLADIFLRFVQRNAFRNKLANPVAAENDPFLLIWLLLGHNGLYGFGRELTFLKPLSHTNGLSV